jgi:tRNA nucleotidyltransferase (CCA-adding enzyme)
MDLVLCHTTADFDTLGAAVGLTRLQPGARIVLTGGTHPTVRDFLALHRDEYPLIERRSVSAKKIRSLTIVDTQLRDRLGKAAEWLDLPQLTEIAIYDHHTELQTDIPATRTQIEPVGSCTTLIVEQLQRAATTGTLLPNTPFPDSPTPQILTPSEATVMALGIHVDTGSLTFDHSTTRDALALAWLMQQGASLPVISEYADPGLSPHLQELLTLALEQLQTEPVSGYTVSWVLLETPAYVPGMSSLASELTDLTESDALLLANRYPLRTSGEERLSVIGRSRIAGTNLNELFKPLGGGGHPRAASLVLKGETSATFHRLVEEFKAQIPLPPVARELMSSPVRTIRPDTTIYEAQRILLRYGHSGLSVVDASDSLVGVISRRDLDIALHHGFSHAPVKGYMTANLKTITPSTPLPEIEALMVTYDIGRLPVLENGQLVGIVTRTDVLRELHQLKLPKACPPLRSCPTTPTRTSVSEQLRDRIAPELWQLLATAAKLAEELGCQLYLVGGAVRDLLLASPDEVRTLSDIDLVVDGYHPSEFPKSPNPGMPNSGSAGVDLAKALQKLYPGARLDVHGQFQTAALLWRKDPVLDSLWVDIATARTEFYPYPAANPEVEASSIRQDLYRRDFTINALAVRLSAPRAGELLDFFGGLLDLRSRQIRVLHANSFIEDPTRIYRAVRFAVRLGFEIDPQTEGYIRHAIESGIYDRTQGQNNRLPALETRLKTELKYILQAAYWKPALQMLDDLGALKCIHPTLQLDERLWKQLRLTDRCLRRYDVEETFHHWQMRLEVLIAYLAAEYREPVGKNLQLSEDSMQRLRDLAAAEANVMEFLPQCVRQSEIVRLLRRYELPTLILIAVGCPRAVRRLIWQYITNWSRVEPPLNGHDLKALGYKPGRDFKRILDELLAAALDGAIGDKEDALRFLAERFPRH